MRTSDCRSYHPVRAQRSFASLNCSNFTQTPLRTYMPKPKVNRALGPWTQRPAERKLSDRRKGPAWS